LHGRQVRRACLRQFPHRRFLVSLLCGLEDLEGMTLRRLWLEAKHWLQQIQRADAALVEARRQGTVV
jgi:hypothetical protein